MEIEDYEDIASEARETAREYESIIRFIKMMHVDIVTELDNERLERHAHSRKKLKAIKERWTKKHTREEDQAAIKWAIRYLDEHLQEMYKDSYAKFISWLKKECI